MKGFSMSLPEGFADSLQRRHHGNPDATMAEKAEAVLRMRSLWEERQQLLKQQDELDTYWDTAKIESHFGEPIFYGAHRRLRALREKREKNHRAIFTLLVNTDGNPEPFNPGWSMDAESCYQDFMAKYGPRA